MARDVGQRRFSEYRKECLKIVRRLPACRRSEARISLPSCGKVARRKRKGQNVEDGLTKRFKYVEIFARPYTEANVTSPLPLSWFLPFYVFGNVSFL